MLSTPWSPLKATTGATRVVAAVAAAAAPVATAEAAAVAIWHIGWSVIQLLRLQSQLITPAIFAAISAGIDPLWRVIKLRLDTRGSLSHG